MKIPFPIKLTSCTCLCLVLSAKVTSAADFSNAQQIFVPASLIPRRYDNETTGQTNWGANVNSPDNSMFSVSAANSASVDSLIGALDNAKTPQSVASYMAKGKRLLQKLIDHGQWDDAERLARELYRIDPQDGFTKTKLAQILTAQSRIASKKSNYKQAAQKAREALFYEPLNQPARLLLEQAFSKQAIDFKQAKEHLKLADNFASANDYVQAMVEYRLANEIKPSASGHIGLGNIDLSQGRIAQAKRHYQTALALEPKSELALRQLGSAELAYRELSLANRDLSKALALDPKDTVAASKLIELWQDQVKNHPGSAASHLGLGRAYLISSDLDQSKAEYKEVAKIDPNNPQLPACRAAFKLALAKSESKQCLDAAINLNSQGAFNDAHAKLSEALRYTPHNAKALLLDGQVCEKLSLIDAAHADYMTILKIDPKNVLAARRLKAIGKQHATTLSASGATGNELPAKKESSLSSESLSTSTSNESAPLPGTASSALSGSVSQAQPDAVTGALEPQTPLQAAIEDDINLPTALDPVEPTADGLLNSSTDNGQAGSDVSGLSDFAESVRNAGLAGKQQLLQNAQSTRNAFKAAGLIPGGQTLSAPLSNSPTATKSSGMLGYPNYGYPNYGYPGIQPGINVNTYPYMMTPQMVPGQNPYLMSPGIPVMVSQNNQNQNPNPLLNNLSNTKLAQKFHVAQVVQDGGGFFSLVGKLRNSIGQSQQQNQSPLQLQSNMYAPYGGLGMPGMQYAPMQPQLPYYAPVQIPPSPSSDLLQVPDWNTGSQN